VPASLVCTGHGGRKRRSASVNGETKSAVLLAATVAQCVVASMGMVLNVNEDGKC
jgi:hypothetical protein